MKKDNKSNKNKQKPQRTAREDELRSLDSQLGSFGLEPPKVYRRQDSQQQRRTSQQQSRNGSRSAQQQSRRPASSRQNTPRTPQEKVKQQNQKRRIKKKVRNVLYASGLVVLVAAVLITLSLTVLFKIDTINITGNEKYSAKQISAVMPIEKDKNLFMADVKGAKKKLEENLPYIYNAEITRKFPSTINVAITEVKTIYRIKNADKTYTLLDNRFKVLEEHAAKVPAESIEIKKATVSKAAAGTTVELKDEKMLDYLKRICATINKVNMKKVTAIYSKDINNNYIVYDNRITIKLGAIDKSEQKLFSALAALEKLEKTNPAAHGEMTATSDKQIYFTEK